MTGAGGDIFVVGAPRSGTTWVQAVLSGHPALVTSPETRVFEAIDQVDRYWSGATERTGVRVALRREEFDGWRLDLWHRVRSALLAADPMATRVLEKTPAHARRLQLIRSFVPGARFVHVVRDPRSCVRSLLEAGEGWGERWAPDRVELAASMWREHVRAALAQADPADTFTVSYEDLRRGPAAWSELLDALELDAGWQLPDLGLAPSELSAGHARRPGDAGGDEVSLGSAAAGFSFHTRGSDASRQLTGFERRYVEHYCAAEMSALGYAGGRRRRLPHDQVRVVARGARRMVADAVAHPSFRR